MMKDMENKNLKKVVKSEKYKKQEKVDNNKNEAKLKEKNVAKKQEKQESDENKIFQADSFKSEEMLAQSS